MTTAELERAAQQAAEKHLRACEDALDIPFDAPDGYEPESPACAPFDGCPTCVVREVLFAAWPYVLELAREEVRAAGQTLKVIEGEGNAT